MAYTYLIHGLLLSVPFACDELIAAPDGALPDIVAKEGEVPRTLASPYVSEPSFDAADGAFLFRGGMRSARFLVQNGTQITFSKNRECQDDLFFHHLLYPVMAAVLRQRRLLPLHASGASNATGAVLLTGDSGAGKSTTISQMVSQGWSLQADDLCALQLTQNGELGVLPGTDRVHLCEEALARLPYQTACLPRRDWHRNKAPLALVSERKWQPIFRIVHLRLTGSPHLQVKKITGQGKLSVLFASLYGPALPTELRASSSILLRSLKDIEMVAISRPRGKWSMNEVLEHVIGP